MDRNYYMKALIWGFLAATLSPAIGSADCVEPPPVVDVPDGTTATQEAMLAAFRAMRAYDLAVKKYADCLQRSGGSAQKQDEAVERLRKIAERFNAELRAFKAKNAS